MLRRLKGGGFKVRLNAGSIRHSADSGHTKVVRLDVFHPDLICYVATACNPIAPCPQVLAPVAFKGTSRNALPLLRHIIPTTINRPFTSWHCLLFPRNLAATEQPVGGSLSRRHHRPKLGCLAAGKNETPP